MVSRRSLVTATVELDFRTGNHWESRSPRAVDCRDVYPYKSKCSFDVKLKATSGKTVLGSAKKKVKIK
jgi:hypothetical protein